MDLPRTSAALRSSKLAILAQGFFGHAIIGVGVDGGAGQAGRTLISGTSIEAFQHSDNIIQYMSYKVGTEPAYLNLLITSSSRFRMYELSSSHSTIVPDYHAERSRREGGMTLTEVMAALAIFAVTAVGVIIAYGFLNTTATRLRCDAVASAILRAKVAKVLTDTWIVNPVDSTADSNIIPVDCVVTSGEQMTTADPNDPYDAGCDPNNLPCGANEVILLSQSDSPLLGFVTGTLYRNTRVFEAAANTVVVDYRLSYTIRGKTYNAYASAIRAQDK